MPLGRPSARCQLKLAEPGLGSCLRQGVAERRRPERAVPAHGNKSYQQPGLPAIPWRVLRGTLIIRKGGTRENGVTIARNHEDGPVINRAADKRHEE